MRAGLGRVALSAALALVGTGAGEAAGQPPPPVPCTDKSLALRFEGRKDGLHQVERYILFRNRAAKSCALAHTPEAASVFVADGDFHSGVQAAVKRPTKPGPGIVLREGEDALLVLTYGQCLPADTTKRTYLALRLAGKGPGRDVAVDAPSEPLTLDGGALRQCDPLTVSSFSRAG